MGPRSEMNDRGRALYSACHDIMKVESFAFYGHEFSSFETNLSYRVAASSSVVPMLLSIITPQLNHKISSVEG